MAVDWVIKQLDFLFCELELQLRLYRIAFICRATMIEKGEE